MDVVIPLNLLQNHLFLLKLLICDVFFFKKNSIKQGIYMVKNLYCKLNYHDQKIRQTPTYDKQKHWTAVLTLLGLISNVYHDLHHLRSNQQPQIAESKLYNWVNNPYFTQGMPN